MQHPDIHKKRKCSALFSIALILLGVFCVSASNGQGWKTSIDSGDIYRSQKVYESAISWYETAREILSKDSLASASYGLVCRKIGETYISSGALEKGIQYCRNAKEQINKAIGNLNAATIAICDFIGQSYFFTNRQQAEIFFIEAKDIRLKIYGPNSLEFSVSCNMLGGLYSTIGQYEKSVYYHLQAKKIRAEKLGRLHPDFAQSCNNLGVCYWSMGEYEQAESLALEAKAVREKMYLEGKNPTAYAFTCASLGNIYRDMGQYSKAESFYLLSKEIREKNLQPKDPLIIQITNSVADLYGYMGRYKEAEKFYLEARNLCKESIGIKSSTYAMNSNNLADLYQTMGRNEEAEILFLEARDIWNETTDADDNINALNRNSLGALYFQLGDYPKAEIFLKEARGLWDTVNDRSHPFYSKNLYNLARVSWNLGKIAEAKKLYTQAFSNEFEQVNKFFRFTNEEEKQKYLDNIVSSADENMSFYYRTNKSNTAADFYTVSVSNKALILASSRELRRTIYETKNATLQKQFETWTALKQRLSNLYIKSKGFTDDQMHELEVQADSLERILSRSSSAFLKKQQAKPNWKEVQKKLKPGEVAIEFSQFRLFNGNKWTDSIMHIAILLKKELPYPVIISLFEKSQLDSMLSQSKNNSVSGITSFYSRGIKKKNAIPNGEKMYKLIWQPLERYLKNAQTIYFAPTGDLHKVSFAALTTPTGKTISDQFRLVQLSTTELLSEGTKSIPIHDITLYGGIDYGKSDIADKKSFFSELPATKTEVEAIGNMAKQNNIRVELFTDTNATESSLKKLSGKSSPSLLHIATHGFFFIGSSDSVIRDTTTGNDEERIFRSNDNPLFRSGMAFAASNASWEGKSTTAEDDGILTAYEVSNLYFPNTRTVVLSACETALGDIQANEGVFGLQRAFKMAGVDYLLMSLWEVPDVETAEFMRLFYENLFRNQSVSNAFLNAQRLLRNKYRAEPYKWAAWVLVR